MSDVLVFGRLNPDNDAIMSAVVLSQLLNQVGYQGNTYEARHLGPLPAESEKLLAEVGVAEPELLESIPAAGEPQKVLLTDHNEAGRSPLRALRTPRSRASWTTTASAASPPRARCTSSRSPWGSSCSIVARASSTCSASSRPRSRRSSCSPP